MTFRLPLVLALACLAGAGFSRPHRVVVDLCSGGRAAMRATLGNIENLRKALGSRSLEIEVVAYGPGIDLVTNRDNDMEAQVRALHAGGVVFTTCANTMKTRHIEKGQILSFVKIVPAGVAEVVLKQEEGWSYLRR